MPKRSAVEQLPEDVKAELDQKLIQTGFSGYLALEGWLEEKGLGISKSALHRYGQQFEERVSALKQATDQAKAIVEASPDEGGAMNEALIRLVQEKLFSALIDMQNTGKLNLTSLARVVAELGKTSVQQKEYMGKVQEKAQSAAKKVEKLAQKGGLSQELVKQIKSEVLRVAQ